MTKSGSFVALMFMVAGVFVLFYAPGEWFKVGVVIIVVASHFAFTEIKDV